MLWSRFLLLRLTVLLLGGTIFSGCGPKTVNSPGEATYRAEGTESEYKATPISYSVPTVNITSRAQFRRFDDYDTAADTTTSCGTAGNPCKVGLVTKSTYDIRYAEAHIYNSAGALIQAGETDGSGNITLAIPITAGTYTLKVNSRANNNYLKASVLNNPYDKQYYSISKSFTLTGSESGSVPVTMTAAPYDGTMEGAAFNILDDILKVNEFLRAHANGQSTAGADYCPASVCSGAQLFSVAPKVNVYWTKGLSPATYYGEASTPISFFVPTSSGGVYEGLYILGGVEGDICVDTDHYDNSVIVHEYGHFLEKTYAKSDTPGGSHNGNKVIDPRLAWSEGWAQFIQAAVLGRTVIRDTKGNADCTAVGISSGFSTTYYTARLSYTDFDLETQTSGQDVPANAGEGNFREISIARSLFDTMTGSSQASPNNYNIDSVSGDLGFALIWRSFVSLADTTNQNRNIGLVNKSLHSKLTTMGTAFPNSWADDTGANTNAVLVKEKQRHDSKDYSHLLTRTVATSGSCTGSPNSSWHPWGFTNTAPVKDTTNSAGSITWSDMMNTNDFHLYYYDGTSTGARIYLKYRKDPGYSNASYPTPWDLDLYVYTSSSYVFLDNSTIVRRSESFYPESSGTYPGLESVDLTGLSAGYYLINIKVDYAGSSATRKADTLYYLELANGEQLCP